MDEESFLPIDSVEISPMIAKRNMQFYDIINEIVQIRDFSENLFKRRVKFWRWNLLLCTIF